MIQTIIQKSLAGKPLSSTEIGRLFEVPVFSSESMMIISAARKLSEQLSNGVAEVHAQVGLNSAPCPMNCRFCSFASVNKMFTHSFELPVEEVVARARQFEADGANAVYLMTTADYSFEKYIEMSTEVRNALRSETVLVANIGDFSLEQAQILKDIGFSGIYHAVRLGEGRDTGITIGKRLETFRNAQEVGLSLGTCVEPVGTEHSVNELVEKTIITRDAEPVYSGAARRIPLPGTSLEQYGIVSEAKMAHILGVVRLALSSSIQGNCTHEPNVLGAFAGANLLWAEVGTNPRDTVQKTEEQRGMTVQQCVSVLKEAEWTVPTGPSQWYTRSTAKQKKTVD